ncbi:putative mitochondrial NDUFA5/B13 subunit [Leptomonas pyrrhocoris]|uniref:Putative mitochondrial NDUFA5/B13 subunit n=1 Tax=Leptomonas pyrrhocoris TaxID=157538 RepID=A0A0M9GA10_LEPPY|nr:putative mitochondrial NDUFA5/B13 subunit [Leptomonas pyrrhocoris]XP_015664306.1 putative mitochondrial NDUFA5/B13 subunit [Leptomonas pyrrhocoris]KPA85866.1 putative mitochondrial NDUFA5/B13 subunit [Leptomonas pyrrhocoris]KPA85867.1 putative mitochondrial NDUFA5/B13 subunit [Leptomonas pyrrhocoris]|eukprot:XP_015664305.1 putative mitochondrial NDUFA5/B13 subunit [Leptomonas pyrrhocoris]
MFYARSLLGVFRNTSRLLTISDEYIPRAFPVKSTTGLAGVAVEPLWKPKLLAAASELQAFLTTSDIPPESTYYNVTMTLVKRINYGIKECQDDWCTLEKKFFWGWPVEYILQVTWRELETAQKWNEWRFWELDPEQVKRVGREDQNIGKEGIAYNTPWEQVVREDFDKRKKALTQEEMAELKRMDTERMARETAAYKERKERIRDDLEKARGDMLKKFLNKRYAVDKDLMRMQPGNMYTGKKAQDLIDELRTSAKQNPPPAPK